MRYFLILLSGVGLLLTPCATVAAEPDAELPRRMGFDWPDRRPVGRVFISNTGRTSEKNPGGYLGRDHDLVSESGRRRFREALIDAAQEHIRRAKRHGAQGVIVWDLCGARERGMMYVGDPRMLPEYSPHFNKVVDAYFKQFREAGVPTGLTLRPIHVRPNKPSGRDRWGYWGYEKYVEGEHDVVGELADRIRYAKKRWGCSIFYIDSNLYMAVDEQGNEQRTHMGFGMIRQLHERHPNVLLLPEHEQRGYYAWSAPYTQIGGGRFGTPEKARDRLPEAFSFINPFSGDAMTILQRWPGMVEKVHAGDAMFIDAFRPGWRNVAVELVYADARLKDAAPLAAGLERDRLKRMVTGSTEATPIERRQAALRLARNGQRSATEPLRAVLAAKGTPAAVRKSCIRALVQTDSPEAIGPLVEAARNGERALIVRLLAVRALADLGDPAADALAELTRSDSGELRTVALWGLERVDAERGVNRAIAMLHDDEPGVRVRALRILRRHPQPRAVEPLAKLLESRINTKQRLLTVRAIAAVGNGRAVELLQKYRKFEHPRGAVQRRVRRAARRGLKQLDGDG